MCRINRDDPDKWDAPYLNLKCYGKGSEYLCQCDFFFLIYCFYCSGSDSGGNIRSASSVSFNMHVFVCVVY